MCLGRTCGWLGGVSAIQQYLRAGLVDEMHLAYGPMLLVAASVTSTTSWMCRTATPSQSLRVHRPRFTSASCVNPESP
jgi:riboflavin biosynthesis pyrimidine reductase